MFADLLPADAILVSEEACRPFECDGLSAYRSVPHLVLLPASEAEVVAIVKRCAEHGVVIVPRGAGTGLSGGAMAIPGAVMLVLSRMSRMITLDAERGLARVEPGVRNLAISEAAASHGLYYAPDPSSQIACSIGGNVAENAGGVHCLKYGLTVNNVQALRCVLPDGEILELGGECLDEPGLDLLALMHGSEGMLGIVTEVTVRLLPIPPCIKTLLVSFDSVSAAAQAVADVLAAGVIPAGMEMMDHLAISAAEDFAQAGYPREAQAILIIELDGLSEDVAANLERLKRVLQAANATEVREAESATERALFWKGRKSAFPAVGRLAPDYYCMDGTIPKQKLPEVLAGIAALSEQAGLPVANVFHAGDGNLHPLILFDANIDGQLEMAEQLGGDILALCVTLGGTITGEHGVGREKLNQMCVQFSTAELEQFKAVKEAFDPARRFNPNKNIPTLARCAEFGAMHVHNNELPHPHLERF
ncbi:MAG: FAD-linked oxidase C-terminal domain-containing protein [Oleiphilaceae bacterium]|nr:FAD-linked oxidase C-terminal domain-containing protein [Oleiphilaceae bacterium]